MNIDVTIQGFFTTCGLNIKVGFKMDKNEQTADRWTDDETNKMMPAIITPLDSLKGWKAQKVNIHIIFIAFQHRNN